MLTLTVQGTQHDSNLNHLSHHHQRPSRLRCRMKASSMLSHSVRSCDTATQFYHLPRCFVMASAQSFFLSSSVALSMGFPHCEIVCPIVSHSRHVSGPFAFLSHDDCHQLRELGSFLDCFVGDAVLPFYV